MQIIKDTTNGYGATKKTKHLEIGATIQVFVEWESELGRTYLHTDKEKHCLDCPATADGPAAYTDACEAADHTRQKNYKADVTEKAPKEAALVSQLYRDLHAAFKAISLDCGKGIYLIAAARREDLQKVVNEMRTKFAEQNAVFKTCSANFELRISYINPDAANDPLQAETLKTIRNDVDRQVAKILEGLASGELDRMRKAFRETRFLADIVAGDSEAAVKELRAYANSTADRLRDATRNKEADVEAIIAEARQGARRFAADFEAILGEEQAVEGQLDIVRGGQRTLGFDFEADGVEMHGAA